MAQTEQVFFDRVENIMGRGENAGKHYFLLFQKCFQKLPLSDCLKFGLHGTDLLLFPQCFQPFLSKFRFLSLIYFVIYVLNSDQFRFLLFGKDSTLYQTTKI